MYKQKILVIIPAYNEEKSIGNVVSSIRKRADADIIIINDGSSDKTSQAARRTGAKVLDLPFNLGIGGAMQTGYIYARNMGYDIAVQIDGDGQHDPAYMGAIIGKVSGQGFDMAIGSRYVRNTSYKSSISRRLGMIILSHIVRILTGLKIEDTTSGYRAVNRKVIECFAASYPTDYPEVDVLVRLHRKGLKICEIPVEMQKRQSGKSSITAVRSIYYMIKVSVALIINSLRAGEAT